MRRFGDTVVLAIEGKGALALLTGSGCRALGCAAFGCHDLMLCANSADRLIQIGAMVCVAQGCVVNAPELKVFNV
jgi:hypothetical protein